MNSGKSILIEFVKAIGIAIITLFIASWFAGSSDIEYKSKSIDSNFNVPTALEGKLKIMNGTTEIENISVVNFGLYNRSFSDYENVKIHIEIQGDKPPKLLSSNFIPPERLTKSGISELGSTPKSQIGYSIDVFKTSIDDDYYLIHLIFEGTVAPTVKIRTSTKNIEVTKYKEWRDWAWVILMISLVYAVILIPFAVILHYSTKRSKNRYLVTLKSRWAENDILNEEQLEHVANTFIEERDRKIDGYFTKIRKKITATE